MILKEPFQLKEDTYFLIQEWIDQNPNLVAGFTTKNDGFSSSFWESNNFGFHVGDYKLDVVKNREKLANQLKIDVSSWVCCEQTHGKNVKQVSDLDKGLGSIDYDSSITDTDGLYTKEKNILLGLCFADCVPIYFYEPNTNLIGIVHAGWKGTVLKIGNELIDKWEEKGAKIDNISVCIGPSICNTCYIVDNNVIQRIKELKIKETDSCYVHKGNGQYSLDLKQLNKVILRDRGIPEENILMSSYCSSCDHQYFYSHRRDGGKTGRMMAFICLKGE